VADFTADERKRLAETDEVHVGFRPGQRIPIWIVIDADAVYVRSVRGPDGKWYQALAAGRPFTLRAADAEWSIAGQHVTDQAEVARVSEAFSRKYQQRWPGPTAAMLRPEVLPTTMRVAPA
jgi:hypothetical protein